MIQILKVALAVEEANKDNPNWMGFQYGEVLAAPARLTYLVQRDVLRWGYKSSNFTHYKLTNPELVKATLEILKKEEAQEFQDQPLTIPEDIFDIVVGFQDIKETIVKSLKAERPVHILLVGPPATGAKTLFLEEINTLPGARYTLGSTDTKAGITRFLMAYKPRFLIVDEMDKMAREDYAALLSLMETGVVTEMKTGRTQTLTLKTWVFGAANDIYKIPDELKSRFLRFVLKPYGEAEFIQAVRGFLVKREDINEELATYIAQQLAKRTKDPRVARSIGRLCKTKEDVDRMIRMLLEYRGL